MRYYLSAGIKTLSFFVLLPIATHLLPKAEVGKFFFWLAVVQLGAGITTLGLSSAVARKAYNLQTTEYVAGVGVITALGTGLLTGLIGLATGLLTVIVLVAWITRSMAMIAEARTIAKREIAKLALMYFAYAGVLPVISLVAILYWSATYESLLIAFIASEGLIAIFGLWALRIKPRYNLRVARSKTISAIRKGATYGVPIMIAGLANLGLNSADRFIVAGYWDFTVVAEFSVMYTIAFASNRFITAPANMKIFPELVRGKNDLRVFERVRTASGLAWLVSVAYCVVITLLGPMIVRLLLSDEYEIESLDFALVSAASALFLVFTFNSSHLKIRNKTATIMLILFAALAISISLSLLIVPTLGYRGAAISTFISYASLAAWAAFYLRPILLRPSYFVAGGLVLLSIFIWAVVQ